MKKYFILVCVMGMCISANAASIYSNSVIAYRAAQAWLSKDYSSAFQLFKLQAEQNVPAAEDRLASLYYYGQGVPRDYKQAYRWYKQAAENNVTSSQYMLGYLYLHGQGIEQDYKQAQYWLKKAATKQFLQPQLLQSEPGSFTRIEQQVSRMSYSNRRAAEEQWMLLAQRDLGSLYGQGLGVDKNLVEAYAWYDLVASRGDKRAQEMKQAIAIQMSPQEMTTAKEITQGYNKKYGARILGVAPM